MALPSSPLIQDFPNCALRDVKHFSETMFAGQISGKTWVAFFFFFCGILVTFNGKEHCNFVGESLSLQHFLNLLGHQT